jgi:hypothetical protein
MDGKLCQKISPSNPTLIRQGYERQRAVGDRHSTLYFLLLLSLVKSTPCACLKAVDGAEGAALYEDPNFPKIASGW